MNRLGRQGGWWLGLVLQFELALTLSTCGTPRNYDPCENNRCKDGSVDLDASAGSGGGGTGPVGGVGAAVLSGTAGQLQRLELRPVAMEERAVKERESEVATPEGLPQEESAPEEWPLEERVPAV
jgi:hypothetical protein